MPLAWEGSPVVLRVGGTGRHARADGSLVRHSGVTGWLRVVGLVVVTVGTASACHQGEEDSCDDPYGRGPVAFLGMDCVPLGPDVQCQAKYFETGYCTAPSRSFTSEGRWISSDEGVGLFVAPGRLRAVGTGGVGVHVESRDGGLQSNAQGFFLSPGLPAERLMKISVIVSDGRNSTRIPDVTVDLMPQRGDAQRSQTNALGFCEFWGLRVPTKARGSKTGYSTVEVEVTFDPDSFYGRAEILLRPLP